MGSIYHSARLDVPADVAWDYLDRFTRAEVIPFSAAGRGRREGEYRVVTMPGGHEIWERNVTVDPVRRRTSYTITGLNGAEHHHAELRVDVGPDDAVTLVWVTDYLPHELADQRAAGYAALFDELVAAAKSVSRRTLAALSGSACVGAVANVNRPGRAGIRVAGLSRRGPSAAGASAMRRDACARARHCGSLPRSRACATAADAAARARPRRRTTMPTQPGGQR